ncbi:ketoacyl-ACP synthase III [Treponema sp. OMZ 840]|uniref:beta-ketoacyl-ACP synthase III n=1 Tax=Treponema sp. OMZ 840 TaxID=244313 RepID=UPI003D90A2CF
MAVIIYGTGKALPARKMTNADFPAELDTSDEWIKSHTGISSRFIADKNQSGALLAAAACREAMKGLENGAAVKAQDIDLIICATATPDYGGFPSDACIVQRELGAKNAACFDISAACSGFLYALDTAAALMERNKNRYALVCGCEILSRIVDWNDRSTCVLFGDGAGAVLLKNTFEKNGRGIGAAVSGSDGRGAEHLYIDENRHIRMNGRAVYTFAVKIIADTVKILLEREGLSMDDADLIVCHQANRRILEAAAKRLHCDFAKFVCNMEEYGNTSAASVPITLDDLIKSGRLRRGMTIICAGFGAGLTWGGCVIRF